MKHPIERREARGLKDHFALAVTTVFGVGYLPLAPGTFGSIVGVAVYFGLEYLLKWSFGVASLGGVSETASATVNAAVAVCFLAYTLLGIWAAGRSTQLLGNNDPSEAVVDEVIGQLIAFLFVPFSSSWQMILAGFLLFRLFDIWKPYPIDYLQNLPAGIGVCADDILAGVYAGVCLAILYAIGFWI
ncbi:MAG: phosphatidylglycerophosphatase A [Pyrinomonadaceae bacterium]